MLRVAAAGAGAIVTKSIGLQERAGNPNPTVVELDTGLLNAMGLPNPGMEEFTGEMAKVKEGAEIPIIGSIFAGDEDGFLLKLSSDGSWIEYATFLGGSKTDYVQALRQLNDLLFQFFLYFRSQAEWR